MNMSLRESPLRILVLDRSVQFGQSMRRVFRDDSSVKIVAALNDPYTAIHLIGAERPDVLCLDAGMPNIEGVLHLAQVVSSDPVPLVLCFVSQTPEQGFLPKLNGVLAADQNPADILIRPAARLDHFASENRLHIKSVFQTAAHRLPSSNTMSNMVPDHKKLSADAMLPPPGMMSDTGLGEKKPGLLAIGASAGGVEALCDLLPDLPLDSPGTVIVQHIRDGYVKRFADRMAERCKADVAVAVDGEILAKGLIRIAPAGRHTAVRRTDDGYRIAVLDGPRISRHRPSIDVLFRSVATAAGSQASAAILTGMGDDGAQGLLEIRQSGGRTFAQDEPSSLVYGMARVAKAIGAVDEELPLPRLAAALAAERSAIVRQRDLSQLWFSI